MGRSGQEYSGLVRNDQDWSRMIRTGQELSGLVRNDQDWSGILQLTQETLTLFILTHLCTNFVLVFLLFWIMAGNPLAQLAVCYF